MANSETENHNKIFDFPGNAKSHVWKVFGFLKLNGKIDKSQAVCRECGTQIRYTGNTTNLKFHVTKHHPTTAPRPVSSCQQSLGSISCSSSEPSQRTLPDMITKLNPKSPKAVSLTTAIAEHIFTDLRPYSTVESDSFKKILEIAEPKYNVPSRKTFSDAIIPRMFDDTREKVKSELQNALQNPCITTDCWTSVATEAYMTVTCHFINKCWEMKTFVLQTRELPGSHTSEHLKDALISSFNEWEINPTFVVSDNAANIVKAIDLMPNTIHIPCMAHTLNLAVKEGLKSSKQLSIVLARCRQLVAYFKRSALATNILHSKQKLLNVPEHKLLIDVETRWNSTYDMLERLCEQTLAVHATFTDSQIKRDARNLILEGSEQILAEEVINLLKVMKEATLIVSGEKDPSISLILPIISKLKRHLQIRDEDSQSIQTIKKAMWENLSRRYSGSEVRMVLVTATLLDPKYNYLKFVDVEEIKRGKCHLKTILIEKYIEKGDKGFDEKFDDTSRPTTSKVAKMSENWLSELADSDFEDIDTTPVTSPSKRATDEFTRFFAEPRASVPTLLWYKNNQLRYPCVSELALKYLSVPATSVPSERVFSTAGLVVNKKRSCLLPDNVDKIIFLNKNYHQK